MPRVYRGRGWTFVPDYKGIGQAMRSRTVRNALAKTARELEPKAESLARGENLDDFADALTVESGTRPKGRPYSRVVADDPNGESHEYGDNATERRRILGRAGNQQVNTR